MANTFQQRSRIRKGIYTGLILVLFTVCYMHREVVIRAQADSLALREESQGEVELTGSVVRLALTGFKGMATCFLWVAAREKQARHEWSELDTLVTSVAKLQPHFISPWLFQSWNIAFNVSAECDSPHDKYFYIARGIQLLAEGERRNRGRETSEAEIVFPGNPDLRFHLGFYYQLKIGKSDENRTLRSLFQLSCMEPADRDPNKLEMRSGGVREVNLGEFERFCKRHPRLVRRLREHLSFDTPLEVVDFLREHQDIPSRYDTNGLLKEQAVARFPLLPPSSKNSKFHDDDDRDGDTLNDDFDNFAASREWYLFAMEPLPPVDPDFGVDSWHYDVRRHRLPHMTHYIFRQYPALAQVNIAEQLEKEGWFDQEGWTITSGGGKPVWFTDSDKNEQDVTVGAGTPRYSAAAARREAFDRLVQYGKDTGLMMPEAKAGDDLGKRLRELRQEAKLFKGQAEEGRPGGGNRARQILNQLNHYRTMTNFKNHYWEADAYLYQEAGQSIPLALVAKKHYFQAEASWKENPKESVDLYQRWIEEWKRLLEKKPEFRADTTNQEDSYEQQLKYLRRYQEHHKADLQRLFIKLASAGLILPVVRPSPARMELTQIGLCASPGTGLWSSLVAFHPRLELPVTLERMLARHKDQRDRIIPTKNIWGPFDGDEETHFFDKDVVQRVRWRIMYPGKKPPMNIPPEMRKRMAADPRKAGMPARPPQPQ